jgi:hypothetical protein
MQWLSKRFGLVIEFIEHLQTVTTSNYSAVDNSHTLQFTIARAKYSQSTVSSVVAWWWIPTMSFASVLTFPPADYCPTTNSLLQLHQLTLDMSSLSHLVSDRVFNTVHLLGFLIVAVDTCLFWKPLLSNSYLSWLHSSCLEQICHNIMNYFQFPKGTLLGYKTLYFEGILTFPKNSILMK